MIENKPLEVKSLLLKFSATCSPTQSSVSQRHHLYVHWVNPVGYKPRQLVVILASYLGMKLVQGKESFAERWTGSCSHLSPVSSFA